MGYNRPASTRQRERWVTKMSNDDAPIDYAICDEFLSVLSAPAKDLTVLLRAHLMSESLFDRILTGLLPRGSLIVQRGRLSYSQKLVLLQALGQIDDDVANCLQRAINCETSWPTNTPE